MIQENRTEKPSPRRLQLFTERGAAARSRLLGRAVLLLAGTLYLIGAGPSLGRKMLNEIRLWIETAFTGSADPAVSLIAVKHSLSEMLMLPVLGATGIVLFLAFVQVGPRFVPRIERSPDPAHSFAMRTIFLVLRLMAAAAALLIALPPALRTFGRMRTMSHVQRIITCFEALLLITLLFAVFEFAVALVDLFYLRWRLRNSMMMTRAELKQEEREDEGDPLVRAYAKRRAREYTSDG